MTNLKPKLSSRRPGTAISAEERLKKLSAWTEDPAAETAASIDAIKLPESTTEVAEEEKPVKTLKKPVLVQKKQKMRDAQAWDELSDTAKTSFILRPTEKQHAKLKFVGETTYGESMQTIANRAIEIYVDALLKERGLL